MLSWVRQLAMDTYFPIFTSSAHKEIGVRVELCMCVIECVVPSKREHKPATITHNQQFILN